ncbi:MAG TPA: fatty acid desaturase [Alphaproteobacteria bacterium]|jgi:omega-6 fatty acid desaturase (delta-12 desaturase)|nr:fatty acid desaturase [Alphaproteobacteria bacterium]
MVAAGAADLTGVYLTDIPTKVADRALTRALLGYQRPVAWKSWWQFANSFAPFLAIATLMQLSLAYSYWITLALAPLAAGLLVRIFIIQHDCGHGSFFRSRRLNNLVGTICGVLTLTPYHNWRRQHANHHAKWNNLDRRGADVDLYSRCLTVREYQALSFWGRQRYRLLRNPLLLFVLLPPLVFFVLYRFPFDTPASWRRERRSVHLNNLVIAAIVGALGWAIGFADLALVYGPIMIFASIAGIWLFFVQHQFENTSWQRTDKWSFMGAALKGSSFLRLPGVLRWFTGNIGFHHVHHLNPRIPNYRLARCHADNAALQVAPVVTLWSGLKATLLCLWDEEKMRMVRLRDAVVA